MRRSLYVGLLGLALLLPATAQQWQVLFDGKTFQGWEDPARKSPPATSFVIENGCLKSTKRPAITEDLFTTSTFGDFELEFDWKISPGGNSGVKYRIQDRIMLQPKPGLRFEDQVALAMKNRRTDRPPTGQDYVIGFEFQITDNQKNSDASSNGALHQTAALYDMFAPSKDVTRPVGEFNRARIVVKGDQFEHWLNGEKVTEGSLKAPEIARSAAKRWGSESAVHNLLVNQPRRQCPISLQNHGDEAWFRNIRIRKLD